MRPGSHRDRDGLASYFRSDRTRRHLKASAIAFAFVLSATVACQALSILNTIDDWSCSPETERFAMARTLALTRNLKTHNAASYAKRDSCND